MKRRIIIVTLTLLTLYSCAQRQTHNLVVDIDGWGNDSIIVLVYSGSDERLDTLVAENGVIKMNFDTVYESNIVVMTRINDLFQRRLRLVSKAVRVTLLKGEKVTIKGKLRNEVVSYGTSQFKDFEELHKRELPYNIVADSINKVIEVEIAKGDTTINTLFNKRGDEYEKIRDLEIDYVRDNPDSDFSGYITMAINIKRFMECYDLLSDRVKNGKYKFLLDKGLEQGLKYEEYLAAKKGGYITIDRVAPDFTLPSIAGDELSLSDFRGKWVILDFWGSWCGWCIKGVPNMKKFYTNYSSKVEIIGIACNDTDEKWRESVEQYKMNWVNVMDTKGIHNKYAINSFPTKILIDPEGVIKHIKKGESGEYYDEILSIIGL